MFKVRKKYIGKLITKGNAEYTLYNSLPQKYLEAVSKGLGGDYIYYSKPKTTTNDKDNKGND